MPQRRVTSIVLNASANVTLPASLPITADVLDQNGQKITPTPNMEWRSSNVAVLTLNSTGIAKSISVGTASVTARKGNVSSAGLLITVTATPAPPDPPLPPPPDPGPDVLTTVTVVPSTVVAGTPAHAFAKNQVGNLLSTVLWTSSQPSVATVDSSGAITTLTGGISDIKAELTGVRVEYALTVTPFVPVPPPSPVITTVILNPFAAVVGQTSQASATDQNGNVLAGVAWTSGNLTLATVSNSGLVTALSSGIATITGTLNAVSVSAGLNISAIVSPPPTGGGSQRVLKSTDLQYLGAYRCPSQGAWMDFSYGPMTGRIVSGQTRLIMSGNITRGCPVYEFAVPGSTPNPVPTSAPRMTLVTTWNDPYHGKRTTWDTNGTEQPVQAMYPGGMHWSEAQQLLYWTYANSYNTSHLQDWSLGASLINSDGTSTAYGPWRVSGGGLKGPWRCTRVAEGPAGQMLTGATMGSGNSISPWGLDLWDGTFPTAVTPAGFGNPDLPLTKNLTYYNMLGRMLTDGSYTGGFTACRRPGDYAFEVMANAQITQIDPIKNGGVGSWADLDNWQDVTWIDLVDRIGVLYTGKFAAGHIWYSNAGIGNLNCSHGFPPPVAITGPVSTAAYPVLWIYDPADLVAVRAGSKTDYTVTPTETVNAETTYGLVTAPLAEVGSGKTISGQYFDATNRKLYICAPDADQTTAGIHFPLIHVFQVN